MMKKVTLGEKMDLNKFEKNNWFQLIRNRIIRISDGSIIKQDLISGLMLLSIMSWILGTVKFFWDIILVNLFNDLITYAIMFHRNVEQLLNAYLGMSTEIVIYELSEFKGPNLGDLINKSIEIGIRFSIVVIIMFVISLIFAKESFGNEIIKYITLIISPIIVYSEYKFTISMGILIIAITLVQLGKGNVYRFLCNLILLLKPLNVLENDGSAGNNISIMKLIIQLLSCYVISLIISQIFNLPFAISFLLVVVLVMRFGLQFQAKNTHLEILLKGIIYIIVFATVLLSQQIKDSISIFTVLFALYFAVDRFFDLYDEIETLVKKDEINYYLYLDNSMDILEQNFLPDELLVAIVAKMNEVKLFGQLIIRAELGMKNSFENLLSLVKENRKNEYERYRLLIASLEYKIQKKENEKLTIINFVQNNLGDVMSLDNQEVLPIEFLVLYGEELSVQKEYELALPYLSFSKYYSSYHYIDSYGKCKKNIDNMQK